MPEQSESENDPSENDPWSHQRRLAQSLVNNLGFEDAVDACRRACWLGVLEILLEGKDGLIAGAKDSSAPA